VNKSEEVIRDAALRLFARHGFDAVGIRDIATAAGVSLSTLYHYTSSKEDLLFRIMVDGTNQMQDAAVAVVAAHPDPVHRLAGLVRSHVSQQGTHHLAATVIDYEVRALSPDNRDTIIAMRDAYEQLWTDVLADGVRAGVFTLSDTRFTRLALLDMCNGLSRWYTPEGAVPITTIAVEYARIALATVGVHDAALVASAIAVPPAVARTEPDR
jgi:AcrR family transcriptional regulator